MNTINASFHLQSNDATPATTVQSNSDLPAQVAGQPANYFWKEMIHVGNYVHPTRGYSLNVDRNRLEKWAQTGEKMIAAGVPIPINCDHSDQARDVVGYVKQFKLDGDRLLALCQFIGPDAALTAARNSVSVGINPDFIDGEARNWGEAIVHLALTPVPVVPDQGQFIAASQKSPASDTLILSNETTPAEVPQTTELAAVVCTAEQLAQLQQLIEGGEDLTPDDCIARLIQFLQDPSDEDDEEDDEEDDDSDDENEDEDTETADDADDADNPDDSDDADQADDTDDVDLQAELSAARRQILELSSRLPPVLNPKAQAAMIEAATAQFDAAVTRGGLSPAARDQLFAALVQGGDGKPNLLALSRSANPAGDRALALAVADILLDNPPILLGEKTGLQALARNVPGEESTSIDQLRQYMTKVASVSG
jgi:hypothetical protein